MAGLPIRLRRARRTDFVAVMRVLAAGGLPVPPPDRAALRRFRHIVADLGGDLYVAVTEATCLGVVHLSYARQLTTAAQARVEMLVVAPDERRRGVGTRLLALAIERARRHGCHRIEYAGATGAAAFLTRAGWQQAGERFQRDLSDGGAHAAVTDTPPR